MSDTRSLITREEALLFLDNTSRVYRGGDPRKLITREEAQAILDYRNPNWSPA
jgi:hypothetical protein